MLKSYINKSLPSILFIHGDLQNKTSFLNISNFFSRKGHKIFLFDLPGHGEEIFFNDNIDLEKFIENKIIKFNLKNPIVIGHSSGGIFAVSYLLKTKNISSLILIDSPIFSPKVSNPDLDFNIIIAKYSKLSNDLFVKQKLIDYSNLTDANSKEILNMGLKYTDPRGFLNNMNSYVGIMENSELFEVDIPILIISSDKGELVNTDYLKKCDSQMKNSKIEITKGNHNNLILNPEIIIKNLEKHYSFFS